MRKAHVPGEMLVNFSTRTRRMEPSLQLGKHKGIHPRAEVKVKAGKAAKTTKMQALMRTALHTRRTISLARGAAPVAQLDVAKVVEKVDAAVVEKEIMVIMKVSMIRMCHTQEQQIQLSWPKSLSLVP